MKIKSGRDFWSGLMFVTIGIGFAWGATFYDFGNSARPGPGYFPFGLGVILALIGAMVLFKALTIETADGNKVGPVAWKPLGIVLGSVAAFGFLLPWLGMVLTLPVLIVIAALAGDEFRWREALVNAAVLTLGSWLVFIKGLGLVLPLWPSFIG